MPDDGCRVRLSVRASTPDNHVLLVHRDPTLRQFAQAALQHVGIPCTSFDPSQPWPRALEQRPVAVLLCDAEAASIEALSALKLSPELDFELILLCEEPPQVEWLQQVGAADYSVQLDGVEDWVQRTRRCLLQRRARPPEQPHEQALTSLVDIVEDLAHSADIRDALFRSTNRLQRLTGAARVSVVLAQQAQGRAFVVTSSDQATLSDLTIDLDDYPELVHCFKERAVLLIDDVHRSPLMANQPRLDLVPFRSMVLTPIADEARVFGILYLRATRANAFHPYVLPLLKAIGRAAAVAIRQAELMRELRSETQQNTQARREAERRMRLLLPYVDFFNASADPMLVIDPTGRILFANPLTRQLVQKTALLEGSNIRDFLAPQDRPRAKQLAKGFAQGNFPKGEDFHVLTPTGERIVNVNFSQTLRDERAVLLTLRDVTQQRRTERELRQTTEFLERVIASSVDAIVSADRRGRILVFNRAAARIFGYDPAYVLSHLNVEQLYPPGVAREVMNKIRSPEHGGPDRITDYQVNLLDSQGRHIPVKISAGLIYENGRPAGSVGVFTDIREKLRMRASLRAAQEELRQHERSVAVAQLAGATAHELNQPLTAVLGYAELLTRKLAQEPALQRTAEVIAREAERMANIVKRIGRITRYETMTYVGGSQILDIEKASATTASPEESNDPPLE